MLICIALLRISAVNDMCIIHMDSHYWEPIKTESSIYGHVARLNFVCWLSIFGNFESVPSGTYKIQWRVRVTKSIINHGMFKFRVSLKSFPEESPVTDETRLMPRKFYTDPSIVRRGWLVLTIPGTIGIDKKLGFSKVYIVHNDISSSWKSGLEIDWARLVPVSHAKDYDDAKLYVKMNQDNHMYSVHKDSDLGNIYKEF
ncbi:hypothetical protein F4703DRAFT_1799455 [Phycomyces blakesleeanus]